jgi:uncharacterized protein YcaQ
MLQTVKEIGCLQLDPISAVEKTHLLVLWSRLGQYDRAEIDRLIYQDRVLFEYWAHMASLVVTEDYPIYAHRMRQYPGDSDWGAKIQRWLDDDAQSPAPLKEFMLNEFRQKGALPSRHFEDKTEGELVSSGWTSARNVSRMIDYLWHKGIIMVAHRQGNQRHWILSDHYLPEWTPKTILMQDDVVKHAAQRAIRALGIARIDHIKAHFTRGRYPDLPRILENLLASNTLEKVEIRHENKPLPGVWYLHQDDIALLEAIQAGNWQPKTTLLSPFDNLICDRKRTELLFDFEFRIEIYTPQNKRQYGYYVLPILHGDKLIGRLDPLMNRKQKCLQINAVYAEPNAPDDAETVQAIRSSIGSLATFCGATTLQFSDKIPVQWAGIS